MNSEMQWGLERMNQRRRLGPFETTLRPFVVGDVVRGTTGGFFGFFVVVVGFGLGFGFRFFGSLGGV